MYFKYCPYPHHFVFDQLILLLTCYCSHFTNMAIPFIATLNSFKKFFKYLSALNTEIFFSFEIKIYTVEFFMIAGLQISVHNSFQLTYTWTFVIITHCHYQILLKRKIYLKRLCKNCQSCTKQGIPH